MKTYGLLNEEKIASTLNKRVYKMLSKNWRDAFDVMYGGRPLEFKNIARHIKCERKDDFTKPDIVISYLKEFRYISVKNGRAITFHSERLSTFTEYLSSLGISENTIKLIKFFHFGDGTLDGTGKIRKNFPDLYQKYEKYVKQANNELNKSPDFVLKVIDRVLFQGVDPEAIPAEYIYYGDENAGRLVTKQQVYRWAVDTYKNYFWCKSLHIGPLIIKPHARYTNKEVVSEKRRHEVMINIYNFAETIDKIYKRYGQ